MHKYGERLKEYRNRNGLTQIAMAERLSMPQSNYSRLEKGEQDIKLSMIIHICSTLNIGTDWFIGVSDDYEDLNETMEFYTEVVDTICEMEEDEQISDETASILLRKIDKISLRYNMN